MKVDQISKLRADLDKSEVFAQENLGRFRAEWDSARENLERFRVEQDTLVQVEKEKSELSQQIESNAEELSSLKLHLSESEGIATEKLEQFHAEQDALERLDKQLSQQMELKAEEISALKIHLDESEVSARENLELFRDEKDALVQCTHF